MDKTEVKRLKAMLTIAEADIKACKAMVRIPEHINEERLRCHLNHLLDGGKEIVGLLDAQLTLDLAPESIPVNNP